MPRTSAQDSGVAPISDEAWRRFMRLEPAPRASDQRLAAAAIKASVPNVSAPPIQPSREEAAVTGRPLTPVVAEPKLAAVRVPQPKAAPAPIEVEPIAAYDGPPVEVAWIIEETAQHFCMTKETLLGASRRRIVTRPRQAAMWSCRYFTALSGPATGKAFNRDHTTVLWSCRTIEAVERVDAEFATQMESLRARIRARALHEKFQRWVAQRVFTDEGEALRRIWAD